MWSSRSTLWLLTLAREKLLSQSMGEGRLERQSPVGDVKLFHAESSIVAGRAVPRQVFPRYDAHNHVTAVNNHEMTQPQGSEQLEDPRQRGSMRDGVGR
uniref:Putative secreted protein n=1 Tax=Ixodes ricinus TaxID=34613 RepID=A0A6B0UE75_IXORI